MGEDLVTDHLHTVIVGGGIAGLACAHRLSTRLGPGRVRLLEASDYLGGHVRTTHQHGYQLDWGPNGFLDREPQMLAWVRELGLGGELIQANQAAARRFLMIKGRLVELAGPPKFFVSPLLSPAGKARALMEPLIPAKKDDAPESVYDFAARRLGREAADTLVSAMVLGIFGGDAKHLSLQHCFPRMAAMEREHGGLFKAMLAKKKSGGGANPVGGTLTSLRGGIGKLAERLRDVLGDIAQTESPVAAIEKVEDGFVVHCGRPVARPSLHAKNVILAVPGFVAAELMRVLAPDAASKMESVGYASLSVVCAGFRRDKVQRELNGFGYLIPPNEGRDTMGCLWTTSIFPGTAPEGHVLLRSMVGGAVHRKVVDRSDAGLLAAVKKDVFDLLGAQGAPDFVQIFRHRRAIPQYGLDHGDVLKAADAAEAAHPGLYFTGSALRGVAVIDCVVDAFKVAERILARGA